MSAPRSVSTLTSESLVGAKVSRQPSTNPYICLGNKPHKASVSVSVVSVSCQCQLSVSVVSSQLTDTVTVHCH
jgi:hypothetical protein